MKRNGVLAYFLPKSNFNRRRRENSQNNKNGQLEKYTKIRNSERNYVRWGEYDAYLLQKI